MRVRSPAATLVLAMCVVAVHAIDRNGFSVVLEAIKHDMSLSDTQLGLLAGPAFALFNAAASLPLARLADRFGRRRVLAGCLFLWSGFTLLAGFAGSFVQVALARCCVGFADAAATPVSQSLVAASFPPVTRSGAMALLVTGSYLGSIIGFALCGTLAQHLGWRLALMCMGVPGLVLAAILWLTVMEPDDDTDIAEPRFTGWIRLLRQAAFLDAALAVASANLVGWALVAWLPSFWHRSYGMGSQEIGFWLAGVLGAASIAGVLCGGAFANRLYGRFPAAGLWMGFWTTLASAPLLTYGFLSHDKAISLGCIIASGVTGAVCLGPVYAAVQGLADQRTRATVAAIFAIINTLLGQAVGPLLVGAISDVTSRHYGSEGLRVSLEIASLLGFWPAFHLYRLARSKGLPGRANV